MKALLATKCGIWLSVRCKAIVDVEGLKSGLEAGGYELARAVWWDRDNAGCLLCREIVSVKVGAIWAKMHVCERKGKA